LDDGYHFVGRLYWCVVGRCAKKVKYTLYNSPDLWYNIANGTAVAVTGCVGYDEAPNSIFVGNVFAICVNGTGGQY
jgi:hypothetical protein